MNSYEACHIILNTGVSSLKLEEIISKDWFYSLGYAIHVLKGRFELGEELISKNCYYSWHYARDVLKGRFDLGEKTIMNSYYACDYFIKIMRYNHE